MYLNKYLSLLLLLMPLVAQATNASADVTQVPDKQIMDDCGPKYKSLEAILAELKEHVLVCSVQKVPCPQCLAAQGLLHVSPTITDENEQPSTDNLVPEIPVALRVHQLQLADLMKRQALLLKGDDKKKARKKAFKIVETISGCQIVDAATKNEADVRLLDSYLNGDGVVPNYSRCLSIINDLIHKADHTAEHAKLRLGQMMALGQGISDKDNHAGFALLEQASLQTKNYNVRLIAQGYLATFAACDILQFKSSAETFYKKVLGAHRAPLEALALANYAHELDAIRKATTFNAMESSMKHIRKLLEGPIPPVVRLLGKAVLYRADALQCVRQYNIIDGRIERHSAVIKLLKSCDDSTREEALKSSQMLKDEEEADGDICKRVTETEKIKIADEFIDQEIKLFRRLGWTIKHRAQKKQAEMNQTALEG